MYSSQLLANYGFTGVFSVSNLRAATGKGQLLKTLRTKISPFSGVYVVFAPIKYKYRIMNKAKYFNHFPEPQIGKRWVPDTDIIYIGKAGGAGTKKANLETRIYQLIRHSLGLADNHKGGQDIWLLENDDTFLLCWKECSDSPIVERKLLCEFMKQHNDNLPFGNKRCRKIE